MRKTVVRILDNGGSEYRLEIDTVRRRADFFRNGTARALRRIRGVRRHWTGAPANSALLQTGDRRYTAVTDRGLLEFKLLSGERVSAFSSPVGNNHTHSPFAKTEFRGQTGYIFFWDGRARRVPREPDGLLAWAHHWVNPAALRDDHGYVDKKTGRMYRAIHLQPLPARVLLRT